ncbi:hypothetical protein [Frankia sp. KB5]|uniref:hypothetical protein n=1 Tax=Frankia sp. KB5 TaxID=683318 RepID=UPI000A0F7079|nr:hypothetical protein [Frankia sp. KB5]ORT48499.1 hypothetical protein KBI5_15475 [Frankia sp. KB5]
MSTAAELRPARGQWTARDLDALPLLTDLPTAASILNMGTTKARELARTGQFPVRLIKHGERYAVPVAALRRLLVEADQ